MPARRLIPLAVCIAVAAALAGCDRETRPGAAAEEVTPAGAGFVRVSEEMQAQLGLEIGAAARREVANVLATTGWLEAVPEREVTIRSPVAGFVTEGPGKSLPRLGEIVDKGERLVALQVFLTPPEIAQLVINKEDADIAIEQSRVSMKLAQEQLERVAAAKDAVPGTRLAELKEIYERSKVAYNESRDKLPFLLQEPYDGIALVKPVAVNAPIAGSLLGVHVAPNQFVVQGDPLWTIADWSVLWIRVPVFETDLPNVSPDELAQVAVPGTLQRAPASRVKLLLPTKPRSRLVEILYEVRNTDLALRAGQAVTIELPTGTSADQVVIPRSAVLWDGLGNTWVYVRADAGSFRRQRIETERLLGDDFVVTRGLAEREAIVVTGAESLYGQEFKGMTPVGDDDD
jgi:cobalt-zinc-cadmium efflux system membrane fusion protein